MEVAEYQTLYDVERTFWWFRSLRAVLEQTLRALPLGAWPRILDAGCGTGTTLATLADHLPAHGYGLDVSAAAAAYWPPALRARMCLASVDELPFRAGAFDVALSVDVLESDGVDDARACAELARVVRPGGYVILVVPAYRWLYSPGHHRAVHASRRYTRAELAALVRRAPLAIVRATHVFMSTLPAIALYRFWQRRRPAPRVPRSELRPLPGVLDEAMFQLVDAERRLLRSRDLPFGSSILLVARKTAER